MNISQDIAATSAAVADEKVACLDIHRTMDQTNFFCLFEYL